LSVPPLGLDGSFEADYDVVQLVDTPSPLSYQFHQPGAVPRPDLLLEVTRPDGNSWTGGVRAGGPSVGSPHTGIHATPASDRTLVVARGDAYLIDVGKPALYEVVATGGPVVGVKPIARENVLLLATPWTVTGIGRDGVLWTTRRLAIDGLRLDESEAGRVAGVADPHDLEPRDFVIDLRTGSHEGGTPFP
jgi:hypothetical protein